jgi:CBS domain-containing protein
MPTGKSPKPLTKGQMLSTAATQEERQARAMRWAQVTARDIMRKVMVTVPASAALSEVERILSDNRISGAPVVDAKGHVIGILSWRDVVDAYVEDPDARPRRGNSFYSLSSDDSLEQDLEAFELPEEAEETAQDVMTADIHSVPPDAGLKEIATLMVKHNIHRVLVQENGRFLGILGTMEILNALGA